VQAREDEPAKYDADSRIEDCEMRLLAPARGNEPGSPRRPAYRGLLLLRSRESAAHADERDSCRAERRARTRHVLDGTEV
jgi:hypothetical protein